MKKKFRLNRKGISTVIATIIIVAIAIVMSIAVAYWVMGIGGSFTRFEKLQYQYAYALNDSAISYVVKNTGTAPATIDTAFINGQLTGVSISYNGTTAVLQPGDVKNGTVTFTALPSGTTVELKIQTTAGDQYPTVVNLP